MFVPSAQRVNGPPWRTSGHIHPAPPRTSEATRRSVAGRGEGAAIRRVSFIRSLRERPIEDEFIVAIAEADDQCLSTVCLGHLAGRVISPGLQSVGISARRRIRLLAAWSASCYRCEANVIRFGL